MQFNIMPGYIGKSFQTLIDTAWLKRTTTHNSSGRGNGSNSELDERIAAYTTAATLKSIPFWPVYIANAVSDVRVELLLLL